MSAYSKGTVLVKTLYEKINKWLGKDKSANDFLYILEPLSCVIRLGLLTYKSDGTKISINNNKIYYNDPSVFHGALRWSSGDTRNDIHHILQPLTKATEWYKPEEDYRIQIIFETAVKGLENLKKSYQKYDESNLVCHTIDLYMSILRKSLKRVDSESSKGVDLEEDLESPIYYDKESPICEAFRGIWLPNQIELITKLLLQIESDEDSRDHYFEALENILVVIEKKVNDIVFNIHNYKIKESTV